jgi:DNA polymerase-3 subunit gamma/tau
LGDLNILRLKDCNIGINFKIFQFYSLKILELCNLLPFPYNIKMSLYQKYRPKKLSEVLTQTHVTDILRSSLKTDNLGHAYLFVGTRGAGKTSLGRIFARAVNCSDEKFLRENGEPCNKCDSCKQSLEGSHPDIIEMDAASNRGIEEVRSLKESVDFLPSSGKYKVYIIDEVHMMTKEAFNALLKTLEEPPAHVIFIMCTTELFKIPSTIISRSQVYELKFASLEEITKKLEYILKEEKRSIDAKGLEFIAGLGKGSFRDTESILEKVLNSSEAKDFKFEEVIQILGFSQVSLIEDIKNALYQKDIEVLQSTLQNSLDEGNIINFNFQLSESVYKDIILDIKNGVNEIFKISLFDYLCSLDRDLKNTLNPKLIYTARLLKFIAENSYENVSPAKVVEKDVKPRPEVEAKGKEPEVVKEEKTSYIPEKNEKFNPAAILRKQKVVAEPKEIQKEETTSEPAAKKSSKISKIDFLDFVKSKNMFLYRFFIHKEFSLEGNKIVVDAERKMEKDLLMKPASKVLIQEFGASIGMEVVLEFGQPKVDHRKAEEKVIEEKSKKVEDLDDGEIKEIFKLK